MFRSPRGVKYSHRKMRAADQAKRYKRASSKYNIVNDKSTGRIWPRIDRTMFETQFFGSDLGA